MHSIERVCAALNLKVEMPNLRIPISLIVDDSTPCINPLYYFRKQVDKIDAPTVAEGVPMIRKMPNDFLAQFAEMVNRKGIRGKFSLLPYPAGLGSIGTGLKGFKKEDVQEFISIVKDKVMPNFDITPEILTHTLALDLKTNRLLNISEHDWSQKQGRRTLANYTGQALKILKDVGIDANGVTSPCNFGAEVEEDYARAVLDAQKAVNDLSLTWYFLHFGDGSVVPPKMMYLNRADREAVISVVAGCRDFIWQTMESKEQGEDHISSIADKYLSPDGTEGRLVELFNGGSYIVCCTHWQSLFSNGSRIGLRVLEKVGSRVDRILGEKAQWMKCSEIARYFAAAEAVIVTVELRQDGTRLSLRSPFKCKNFTLSFVPEREFTQIEIPETNKILRELKGGSELLEIDTWFKRKERTYVCFDLDFETTVVARYS